jgi:hypothetical protein
MSSVAAKATIPIPMAATAINRHEVGSIWDRSPLTVSREWDSFAMVHSSHVGFPGHIAHRVNRIRRPAGAPLQPASKCHLQMDDRSLILVIRRQSFL